MKLLLSICLLALLIQNSASLAGILPQKTATTAGGLPFLKRNNHGSNLFLSRRTPQEDLLVNNRYSAADWLHNVFTLPHSSVLRDIRNPVITIALWSTLVSIIQRACAASSSSTLTKLASDMCIGGGPHSFLVSSLGLLLVFRTNSAYQRFNEGRKIWERILSTSRNISRMISLYSKEVGSSRRNRIARNLAAFPYLLRHHVRPGCLCDSTSSRDIPEKYRLLLNPHSQTIVDTRYEGDSQVSSPRIPQEPCWVDRRNEPWSLLESDSLTKVARAQNRPLWICDRIGREIMNIPYGPNFTSRERLTLLKSVEQLTNAVGQCERIHQTAVPLNYARHSLRGLTLWLVTLPFSLVREMGYLTGPTMAVISWLLFGVYQIGYSIEDPFQGSLRLSILCNAIRNDVLGETFERESAFELQNSLQDDLDLMEEELKPYLPPAVNQSDFITQAPSLVRENGQWTVVDA